MKNIYTFEYNDKIDGYECIDHPMAANGEFVRREEYLDEIRALISDNEMFIAEIKKLQDLIQRVNNIGPLLHADSIADVIYGKTANAEELIQLLADCKVAVE